MRVPARPRAATSLRRTTLRKDRTGGLPGPLHGHESRRRGSRFVPRRGGILADKTSAAVHEAAAAVEESAAAVPIALFHLIFPCPVRCKAGRVANARSCRTMKRQSVDRAVAKRREASRRASATFRKPAMARTGTGPSEMKSVILPNLACAAPPCADPAGVWRRCVAPSTRATAGFSSRLGHTEHFEDHLAQPLPAVVDVLGLIAEALALDDQLPLGGDAPPLPAQPLPHVRRERRVGGEVPVQDRLARHLVDVLTARPAGTGEGEDQLPVGDLEGVGDFHEAIVAGRLIVATLPRRGWEGSGGDGFTFRFRADAAPDLFAEHGDLGRGLDA